MRNQRSLAALVLAVVLSGAASPFAGAREQAGARQASPSSSSFDRKRFDELRREGFDALYNLDYEGARRRFQEMAKAFPDHPAGPQFLAAGLWLKTLNESRRLQASLYNTEGFYKEKDDKADPKTVAEFRELTRQAKSLCEARLKADPKDAEALYYLGAVEGLKAAFAGAVERSFMSALRSGSDAVDRHREVLKLDPNFHDAEVTIGMYDYVVGGLPLPVKLMAAIGGIRGSKKKGLATLERVAAEGQWARDDAKSVLIVLYKREKRYMDAYRNASELASKYARNYIFKMESADALVSQAEVDRARDPGAAKKAEEQAFAIFESLLPRGREAAQAGPRAPLDLVHYSYGDALFVAGHAERAAKEFLAAAALPNVEPGMATRTRLRAAQALDVAGKREEAVAQYKAVLARANVFDSHEEAKRGLKEPYKAARKPAEGTASGAPEGGAANAVSPD
jgi:tetratricopeptide (TPR) repeat protein